MKKNLFIILTCITVFSTIRVEFPPDPNGNKKYAWLTPKLYEIIYTESKYHKIDYQLMLALIDAESNGKQYARSPSGAIGYCQIMPFHFRYKSWYSPYQARRNIRKGCRIFARCLRLARGNIVLALRNYERGPRGRGCNVRYIASIIGNYYE